MTRTSLGTTLFLAFLAVALAPSAGCSKRRLGATTTITVGPGPCDLAPSTPVTVSKNAGDQVGWTPKVSGQSLEIVFRKSQMPSSAPPFTNMTQTSNGDWKIGTSLQSGLVNRQLNVPAGGLNYKYDQVLGGQTCDGHIIIQP